MPLSVRVALLSLLLLTACGSATAPVDEAEVRAVLGEWFKVSRDQAPLRSAIMKVMVAKQGEERKAVEDDYQALVHEHHVIVALAGSNPAAARKVIAAYPAKVEAVATKHGAKAD